jgi:hypothetical protein
LVEETDVSHDFDPSGVISHFSEPEKVVHPANAKTIAKMTISNVLTFAERISIPLKSRDRKSLLDAMVVLQCDLTSYRRAFHLQFLP